MYMDKKKTKKCSSNGERDSLKLPSSRPRVFWTFIHLQSIVHEEYRRTILPNRSWKIIRCFTVAHFLCRLVVATGEWKTDIFATNEGQLPYVFVPKWTLIEQCSSNFDLMQGELVQILSNMYEILHSVSFLKSHYVLCEFLDPELNEQPKEDENFALKLSQENILIMKRRFSVEFLHFSQLRVCGSWKDIIDEEINLWKGCSLDCNEEKRTRMTNMCVRVDLENTNVSSVSTIFYVHVESLKWKRCRHKFIIWMHHQKWDRR